MPRPRLGKRAWRAEWGGVSCIVAADSRGRAIRRVISGAEDAGYRPVWTDVKVRREPMYDAWAARDDARGCRSAEYVESMLTTAGAAAIGAGLPSED